MPLETSARIVRELAGHGYNVEREAVTLIASAPDPAATLAAAVEATPDDEPVVETDVVRAVRDDAREDSGSSTGLDDPNVSTGDHTTGHQVQGEVAPETEGSAPPSTTGTAATAQSTPTGDADRSTTGRSLEIAGDITGESTGTGDYADFVSLFRDRYDKLSKQLRGRVNHRPTDTLESMPGGSEAAIVGMVDDVRSTANGHHLLDLEDANGTFPVLITKDRDIAEHVDEILTDEVIAVEGTISDDGGILFVDDLYFPEIPRTFEPTTADRHVQAALISDVHVGSQEFEADAWNRFADWLHTAEAEAIEYLLIAGDMVEGVGVYPDQDEELDVIDVYEQYETFAEHLKAVPGDVEIVMIPGNHDAVRLAEPQPAFDEELRDIMSAHDARITGNPSMVTIEGVSVLMYHGVSLDEMIAELPEEKANYDEPQKPMYQLLKKRHVAPKYGGHMRLAPEKEDYLVIDEVPDIFHTGHVHKLGYGKYRNVLAINSGCWQAQTDFQRSVNIDPDVAYAPIVDLDTLDVTIRKFI
ncbi:DNA polymerase II small subunit [Salinarchaeum sp. Harcht-Bsk1]|uniref:DNA-directed DNA polymerase II small subunit n=1 Tax=Salinarchaeum sp. Harcht-Bsk1 TaxID=1333523 RepID=UPI0003423D8A|nr:DNA-directed DNA polymerase II small subunit [Salinarchaeum sp. Harcht-Bsk1]AGN01446.1 DNA polymerase II small subunit [Salinarchaeum sp. Harcht-Bsk1]